MDRKRVLDCGCWECKRCKGFGLVEGIINDQGEEDAVTCDSCQGYGLSKRCKKHAEEAGWFKDK